MTKFRRMATLRYTRSASMQCDGNLQAIRQPSALWRCDLRCESKMFTVVYCQYILCVYLMYVCTNVRTKPLSNKRHGQICIRDAFKQEKCTAAAEPRHGHGRINGSSPLSKQMRHSPPSCDIGRLARRSLSLAQPYSSIESL